MAKNEPKERAPLFFKLDEESAVLVAAEQAKIKKAIDADVSAAEAIRIMLRRAADA